MSAQNHFLFYMLSKALAATEVDYARLEYLKADFTLARSSSPQDLSEWKSHFLEEFMGLLYSANDNRTLTEAKEALRNTCVKSEYLTSQDSEIQSLLKYADKILSE